LALGACGDDTPTAIEQVAEQRSQQAERVARDAQLPEDVQRFLGRAASAVAATFTVTYEEAGARTTLTQRPPDRRIDVTKDGVTETLLRLRDGTFACNAQGCKEQEGQAAIDPDLGVFSPQKLEESIGALGSARATFRFDVVTKDVAGATADCMVTAPLAGGEADELCIAARSGAIVRIRSASRSLEAVSYKDSADPNAFKLP
jgi:hypothetical protein